VSFVSFVSFVHFESFVFFVCLLLFALSRTVLAQTTVDEAPKVVPLLENVTRVEGWSFFEPPSAGGDPDYTLLGSRTTLGVRAEARRVVVEGSFRYAQLVGLPRTAVGPGPLGPGAVYFAAAGNPKAYQLYFRSMWLRLNDVVPGVSLTGGRMAYESGERTPFAGRLIGSAGWTVFERAFDGVRVDIQRPAWRAHGSFVMPTQGAFEESANPTMSRVQIATASWTADALHVFVHNYRDRRPIRNRPDNSGRLASAADINVQTFGASFAPAFGRADLHAWAAAQRGHWYGDAHRAWSASADVGYGWPAAHAASVSAGALYASGDDDFSDATHRTFFPMTPTTTPDVFSGTYALMNLRDLHARVAFHPLQSLTVGGEVRWLSLATPLDRWYSGTGATALRGAYFGYSTRSSQLARGLGTSVHASVEARLKRYWTVGASAGVVKAGDVVRRQFAGDWLRVFVIQSELRTKN
jgi:Alginate export